MSSITRTLSPDELRVVLKSHYGDDDFDVTKVTMSPYFDDIAGFMGQHVSLVVELKRGGALLKEKFFAKYMPSDKSPFAKHMIDGNGYNKEVFFYTTFDEMAKRAIANLDVRIAPRMHYAAADKLIFEDLGVRGYRSVDFGDVTAAHVTHSMRAIAKLHAIGFAVDAHESAERRADFKLIDAYPDIFVEPLFSTDATLITHKLAVTAGDAIVGLADFLEGELTTGEIATFREEFKRQYQRIMEIFSHGDPKYRRVMSHGDLWLNNLMYRYDEDGAVDDCLIVDFQYVRYAPPAHDVTFTIYYNASKALRARHYDEFLKAYYDQLAVELEKYGLSVEETLPWHEYEESCKMYLTIAKVIKGTYMTINDIPQHRLKVLTSNKEDFYNFLLVDRMPLARKLMKEEPIYYKIVTENLKDIYQNNEVLTVAEVRKVLTNHYDDDDFEIVKVTQSPYFDCINGFLGQHIRLRVNVRRNDRLAAETFFAKSMPPRDSPFREHTVQANCYGKEAFFYAQFMDFARRSINRFDVRIAPRMLYSSDAVLVFEDMGRDGYKSIPLADVSEAHVTRALQVTAKLHAIGIAVEEYKRNSLNAPYKLIDEFPRVFNEPLFSPVRDSIPHKLATNGRACTSELIESLMENTMTTKEIKQFQTDYNDQFDKMMELFALGDRRYRCVLSHGDPWLNNFLFKCEGNEIRDCLMVDFQYLRYAPPAHDVTFIVYFIADKRMRRQLYDRFLKIYHAQLTSELMRYGLDANVLCPFDEFERSCRTYLTVAKIIKSVYAPLTGLPQARLKEICSNADDYRRYLLGDKGPLLRTFLREEPAFRDYVVENLLDIREAIAKGDGL